MARDRRDAAIEAEESARFSGSIKARRAVKAKPGPARYIITSAQNNTTIHAALWANLTAYAKHLKASVLVSQFTYNKAAYGAKAVKPGTIKASDHDELWYAPEILPHAFNERLAITPSLTFCGETNIAPTAANPLSGCENLTNRASGIFPHARQEMRSIASLDSAKFNWTTGCVTLRNYVQKRAGLKAEHFHAYGALVVEVDQDGDFFVRQIRASEDGSFQDLDAIVREGRITTGHRIEAIQPGDLHVAQMDSMVRQTVFGKGGMIDALKPRYVVCHDSLDWRAVNHHERHDPHAIFAKRTRGADDAQAELQQLADFIRGEACRPGSTVVIVESNHDKALMRWLREADFRADPTNAQFYLKAQRMVYAAIAKGDTRFNLLRSLLRLMGVPTGVRFLATGESFVLCRQAGGIEMGMHGHDGVNGSRGSSAQFGRIGRRTCTGHTHSASIVGDNFTAGTSSLLRMDYNRGGPSSWSHSHTLVYANGSRAIVQTWKGKWRG